MTTHPKTDEGDPRPFVDPKPLIPPDALIDAAGNPQPAMSDRFQPRYRPIEPRQSNVSASAMFLAIAALLGLALAFGFDWASKPMQDTAMNEQTGMRVIHPQASDQDQPDQSQPAPETDIEQLPAQPVPEQPPPAGNTTQP